MYSEGEGKTGKTGISVGALLPVISMTQKCGLLARRRAVMCVASRRTIAAKRPCATIGVVVTKGSLSMIKQQSRISLGYVNFAVLCGGIVTDTMGMVPTVETTEISRDKIRSKRSKIGIMQRYAH